jgi:ATP-dependent DNA helicase RecG
MIEGLRIEFKESWADKHLRSVAGFANTDGGTLYIGVNDKGETVGVDDYQSLLKVIPDKIESKLGIVPTVRHHEEKGKFYLSIEVGRSGEFVFLDGKIFGRSGSTTRELKGRDLRARALKRGEAPWTEEASAKVATSQLDNGVYLDFKKKALSKGLITEQENALSIEELFERLDIARDGHPKMGAVLLFHLEPFIFTEGAHVQIGKFEGSNILFQDLVGGPLFTMPDTIMNLLFSKYMIAPISYKGIYRIDKYPYPHTPVREAILNSIMHSDFGAKTSIQIKVYPDRMEISNCGSPPEGWTVETLLRSHTSRPGNPSIASVFHRAGMVEKFGRGIQTIMDGYEGRDVRKPEFAFSLSEFCVTFYDENYTGGASVRTPAGIGGEKHPASDLTDNELKIYAAISESRFTNVTEAASALGISKRSVDRVLSSLRDKGVIERIGSRKDGIWIPTRNR